MVSLKYKTIMIADLAAVEMRVIDGYCFDACDIHGPANLLAWDPNGPISLDSNHFFNTGARGALGATITYQSDLIGIRNTTFQRCTLRDIAVYTCVTPPDSFLQRVVEPRDKLIHQRDMDRLQRRMEELILEG